MGLITPEKRRNLWLASFWLFFGAAFYALEWLVPARQYHVMHHPIDDWIPFCEVFLIPYLFWFVFMVGGYVYTFFVSDDAFRRMMLFTILTYGGGLLVFLLFPTCQNLRPAEFARNNILTELMAWFYTCDTSTNVCPSLHVCGSLAVAYGLTRTPRFSRRGWKQAVYAVALLICVSTVFVKQHSILDTFWGFTFCACAQNLIRLREAPSPLRAAPLLKKY